MAYEYNAADWTKILDAIYLSQEKMAKQIETLSPQEAAYSTPVTKELDSALAKAQGDYPQIGYNKENPYFKSGYATLDHIMVRIRPILSKNGLSLIQQRRHDSDGKMMLHTILKHSSGQWIESRSRINPVKADMQALGSTLSYLKRYDAMALLGVTVSEDPSDDDAEVSMNVARKMEEHDVGYTPPYNPNQNQMKRINKEQLAQIKYELKLCGAPEEEEKFITYMFQQLKIEALVDVPGDKYNRVMELILEMKKRLHEGKK